MFLFIHLKEQEKLYFSGAFRGHKMGSLVRNGLTQTSAQSEAIALKISRKKYVHVYIYTYIHVEALFL